MTHLLLVVVLFFPFTVLAQKVTTMNPNDVQFSPYRHTELAPALLKRIRATTEVFERVDGLSYEMAVDLYKRDANPEERLVLWEEMAKAYVSFCKKRCSTAPERLDVYGALLLRTVLEEQEAIQLTQPKVLSLAEVRSVVTLYRLPVKPIDVVKAK